jgi:hypothetical protein
MANTKLSFAFTEEEMRKINKIKKDLSPKDGPLTNIAVVRKALLAYEVKK